MTSSPAASAESHSPWRAEIVAGTLLAIAGVLPRVGFALVFPAEPISDFRGVLDFALAMRDVSLAPPGYYWDVFNVGPPLVLSVLLRIFPDSPETTARLATAVWTGMMPLAPFAIWRGVMAPRIRMLAGLLLALWPGQIFFSGVVAQDNWVTPPAIALGALAARALLAGRGHPAAAGLLLVLATAMRQEMMYVLLLPALAAAGLLVRRGWRLRPVLAFAVAVGVPFLVIALHRRAATGELALSSGHVGYTLLGTVAPGATRLGWIDPASYVAAVRPELVRDRRRLFGETLPLALSEVRRRPGFQVSRVLAVGLQSSLTSDPDNLYWSLEAQGVQTAERRGAALAWAPRLRRFLHREQVVIHGLFLAAVGLALWKRSGAILVIAVAVVLKVGLHAALVTLGRFLVPATALELLAIAIAVAVVGANRAWSTGLALALAGGLLAVVSGAAGEALLRRLQSRDPLGQLTYRFVLTEPDHDGALACTVSRGRLGLLDQESAVLELPGYPPTAGTMAVAECELRVGQVTPLAVEIEDPYRGHVAGKVVLRVDVGGRRRLLHDVAGEPPGGRSRVPVEPPSGRTVERVRVEMIARLPHDPAFPLAEAGRTTLRLVRHEPTAPSAAPSAGGRGGRARAGGAAAEPRATRARRNGR